VACPFFLLVILTMKLILPSPLQQLNNPLYTKNNIRLFIKRDDLIHENVSGNKWRKLKYNISEVKSSLKTGIITFGGAFSNHLHACSALCKSKGLALKCYVRTDQLDISNPTLKFIINNGAEIKIISRSNYKQRNEPHFLNRIKAKYPDFFVIPEGGTSNLALKGVGEMVEEIVSQIAEKIDYIFVPVGSGGTIAGIIKKINPSTKVIGIAAVNDYSLLSKVKQLLNDKNIYPENWDISFDENFDGFAKFNHILLEYINQFYKKFGFRLDPLYTSKMMFAIEKRIEQNKIPNGSTIVAIHTGGLQGIAAFNYVNGKKIL